MGGGPRRKPSTQSTKNSSYIEFRGLRECPAHNIRRILRILNSEGSRELQRSQIQVSSPTQKYQVSLINLLRKLILFGLGWRFGFVACELRWQAIVKIDCNGELQKWGLLYKGFRKALQRLYRGFTKAL